MNYASKTHALVLFSVVLLAAGCLPGSSGGNNGGGNNGGGNNGTVTEPIPLAERSPCEFQSFEPSSQQLQYTTINEFGERGQVLSSQRMVESSFSDQFNAYTSDNEFDELGRVTNTIFMYEGAEPDRAVRIVEKTYEEDSDRVDVETTLRGPTVEEASLARTVDYQYDLEGNLIRLERSEDAQGGADASVYTYTYDENGVRTSGQWLGQNDMKLGDISYEYDADGFLQSELIEYTEEIGGGSSESVYTRDELGRVTRYEYYTDSELWYYTQSTYACHDAEG